jgi:hypothetical protein
MYSPDELNMFNRAALSDFSKPTYRVDSVAVKGNHESNYAVGLLSYQEAVCMADSCLNDGCYSVRISREG